MSTIYWLGGPPDSGVNLYPFPKSVYQELAEVPATLRTVLGGIGLPSGQLASTADLKRLAIAPRVKGYGATSEGCTAYYQDASGSALVGGYNPTSKVCRQTVPYAGLWINFSRMLTQKEIDDARANNFYLVGPSPLTPIQPLHPSIPIQPLHPSIPLQPVHPSIPLKPVHPLIPIQPLHPSIPLQPVHPLIPIQPVHPSIPIQPLHPSIPLQPVHPLIPIQPTAGKDNMKKLWLGVLLITIMLFTVMVWKQWLEQPILALLTLTILSILCFSVYPM